MATDIKLIGWSATGFRCPDHQVDLINHNNEPYHVSLIQMPNGTGKTTTKDLLRLALSGGALNLRPQEIRAFCKDKDSFVPGVMEVRLQVNKKVVTFVMTFDYSQGKATYKTTYKSGQNSGFVPPQEIKNFLNPQFINYFILDGELAEKLLNDDQAAAQDVIDALFQVDSLKNIASKVEDYWSQHAAGVTTKTPQGLTRQKNRVDEIAFRLKTLQLECSSLDKKIVDLQNDLSAKKLEHQTAIEKNRTQNADLLNAQEKLHILEKEQIQNTSEFLELCASPQNLSGIFASSILNLKLGLDRVKLPEAAAREFFEELCDEPECICGREINPEIANTIRAKASQYLGSDDVSLLNALKTSIDEAVGGDPMSHRLELNQKIEELTDSVRSVNEARTLVEELNRKASQVDPKVKEAQEKIEALTKELTEAKLGREKYDSDETSGPIGNIFGIKVLIAKLEEAEIDLAESTGTLEIKKKTDIIKSILNAAYDSSTKIISLELVDETNQNLRQWLPDNNLEVESIRGHLRLKGKEKGSVGENLSVAYGFLATLFNRTNHSLPFIVDSPAGALDLPVRENIGKTIPKLTKQFVTFVISSERQKFIDDGLQKVTEDIQYITIFRKKISKYFDLAGAVRDAVITDDGVVVDDKSFFEHFDLLKE
jgi:DNA sulfur modification protein DndD